MDDPETCTMSGQRSKFLLILIAITRTQTPEYLRSPPLDYFHHTNNYVLYQVTRICHSNKLFAILTRILFTLTKYLLSSPKKYVRELREEANFCEVR